MQLVVHGLISKRAETVGRINALREEMAQALADLDHLDATIRIFDPNLEHDAMPVRVVPPPNAAFRGEVQRFLLETLRTATGPLSTEDLARAVMECRRMNTADRGLAKLVMRRTGHSLSRLRQTGLATAERRVSGGMMEWRIASPDATLAIGWRNASGAG